MPIDASRSATLSARRSGRGLPGNDRPHAARFDAVVAAGRTPRRAGAPDIVRDPARRPRLLGFRLLRRARSDAGDRRARRAAALRFSQLHDGADVHAGARRAADRQESARGRLRVADVQRSRAIPAISAGEIAARRADDGRAPARARLFDVRGGQVAQHRRAQRRAGRRIARRGRCSAASTASTASSAARRITSRRRSSSRTTRSSIATAIPTAITAPTTGPTRRSDWLTAHAATSPDKPFFLYLAHNAPHAPLHAKADDLARYRGAYDAGWDAVRAARIARQRALGLVPRALAAARRTAPACPRGTA